MDELKRGCHLAIDRRKDRLPSISCSKVTWIDCSRGGV